MINSKQHRGCRIQDPGTCGYRWWNTGDFSHGVRERPRCARGRRGNLERDRLTSGASALMRREYHKFAIAFCLLQAKITTMIDYARLLQENIPLNSTVFSVPELVSDLVNVASSHARAHGVEILFVPKVSAPHRLVGDSLRLTEVLNLLMDNAIRFSDGGAVRFHIWAEDMNMATGKCMMHFQLVDEGRGMDEATLEYAQEPTLFWHLSLLFGSGGGGGADVA